MGFQDVPGPWRTDHIDCGCSHQCLGKERTNRFKEITQNQANAVNSCLCSPATMQAILESDGSISRSIEQTFPWPLAANELHLVYGNPEALCLERFNRTQYVFAIQFSGWFFEISTSPIFSVLTRVRFCWQNLLQWETCPRVWIATPVVFKTN